MPTKRKSCPGYTSSQSRVDENRPGQLKLYAAQLLLRAATLVVTSVSLLLAAALLLGVVSLRGTSILLLSAVSLLLSAAALLAGAGLLACSLVVLGVLSVSSNRSRHNSSASDNADRNSRKRSENVLLSHDYLAFMVLEGRDFVGSRPCTSLRILRPYSGATRPLSYDNQGPGIIQDRSRKLSNERRIDNASFGQRLSHLSHNPLDCLYNRLGGSVYFDVYVAAWLRVPKGRLRQRLGDKRHRKLPPPSFNHC